MVDKTDTVLVEQLKNGDEKAFELLVLRYRPRLIASLTNYTKSVEVSEDISQQTFIRVWQKIDTFRGDSSLFTWIYRIIILVFIIRAAKTYGDVSSVTS